MTSRASGTTSASNPLRSRTPWPRAWPGTSPSGPRTRATPDGRASWRSPATRGDPPLMTHIRPVGLAMVAVVAFLPGAVRRVPTVGWAPRRPAPEPDAGIRARGALKLDPPGKDAHADVAVYKNLAFVGKWSGPCPGSGVDVIDISQPATPALLSHTPEHPG